MDDVDVLVCGGGPAGIAAAATAAKAGARVLLVERSGRLGGMATNALVGPLMGDVESPWVDAILQHIGGRQVDYEFIDLRYADLLDRCGARYLLHAWASSPILDGGRVAGAVLNGKQGQLEVKARVTIDATGDGDIAAGASASFEQGREAGPYWEADGLMQPATIQFRVGGVVHLDTMEANGGRKNYKFPDGRSWNEVVHAAHERGELPESVGFVRTYLSRRDDERVINATQVNGIDGTNVADLTRAEIEGRRQVGPVVDFLRQYAPGFQNAYVNAMPAVIGIRETRRIRGVNRLTADDLLSGRKWPDAVVRGASFIIDIHNPAGAAHAHPEGKIPQTQPYDIPYGCLVPRDVDGLLIAGRCISGSHEAMASYRVQVIAMATGVASGAAAALAVRNAVEPRHVDATDIQRLAFATPVFPPA